MILIRFFFQSIFIPFSIFCINSDSFDANIPVSDFNADGCTLINSDVGGNGNDSAIHITRFGTVAGDVKNISAKNTTIDKAYKVLSFNTNLSAYNKKNISHGDGDIFSRFSEIGPVTLASSLKTKINHNLE